MKSMHCLANPLSGKIFKLLTPRPGLCNEFEECQRLEPTEQQYSSVGSQTPWAYATVLLFDPLVETFSDDTARTAARE